MNVPVGCKIKGFKFWKTFIMRREDKRLEYGWFYGKLFTLGKHNEFKITGERDEKN